MHDAEEALRLARQGDLPVALAYAELVTGVVLASFGEFGTALEHGQEALRLAREIGHQQWIVGASANLGSTYVLMLESAFALSALEAALPLARDLGSAFWVCQVAFLLAQAYLLTHDPVRQAALAAVLPREQRARTLYERWVRSMWGELALAQGHPDQALQIAEELALHRPGRGHWCGRAADPLAVAIARGGAAGPGARQRSRAGAGGGQTRRPGAARSFPPVVYPWPARTRVPAGAAGGAGPSREHSSPQRHRSACRDDCDPPCVSSSPTRRTPRCGPGKSSSQRAISKQSNSVA